MITPFDIGLPSKFTSFRSYPGFDQFKVASSLSSNEKRVSLAQVPTGGGKSVLYTAAAKLQGWRTLVLTPTKHLQSQLLGDFHSIGLKSISGHSTYPCADTSYDHSGEILDFECSVGHANCGYWQDVSIVLGRDYVVTNPANWITIAKSGDPLRFGQFDCLVIDEAHNLPILLCDLLSVRFSERNVHTLINLSIPSVLSLPTWISWAKEALSVQSYKLSQSQDEDENLLHGRKSKTTQRLEKLGRDLSTIASITNEWVVEQTENGAKLTPAYAEDYAEEWLFRGIPHIILSSATLTSQDAEYLGLTRDDYNCYEVESVFSASRRPFIYLPTVLVDYKMEIGHKRLLVNRIDQIIESRLDRKGLIQSISYDYAEMVKSMSNYIVTTHDRRNKREVIERFMMDATPGVLTSPVIDEGLDFADWKARYQIILKVPSSDSRDPLTKVRSARYPKWSLYLKCKTILQMYGRIVRSERDWGETFILDKYWERYMSRQPWPKYFTKAVRTEYTIPKPIEF